MLSSAIIRIVDFCARYPRRVFVLGILLAAVAVTYDVARFSITTDTENLIANDLPWRHRQADFANAFPQKDILVVVTAENVLANRFYREAGQQRAVGAAA